MLWKHIKTGAGLGAIRAWRQEAVSALVHAKIIALCLARLLQLTAEREQGEHATTQLLLVLCLHRSVPLMLAMHLHEQGVTLAEMERRILLLATILGKARNRRRERAKRAKRAKIGAVGATRA